MSKRNKKSTLPVKWMLWALIILVFVAFRTHQLMRDENRRILSTSTNATSQNSFSKFLADIFGFRSQSSLSKGNNGLSPNNPGFGQIGGTDTDNQQNPNSSSVKNKLGFRGNNALQEGRSSNSGQEDEDSLRNNPSNNSEINSEINAEANTEQGAGNLAQDNPEVNAENNPQTNSEVNAENNSENNAINNPGNNPGNNPDNNPGDNSGSGQGNGPGSGSGSGSGSGPGSGSGSGSRSSSGSGSGSGSGGGSGNPTILPTLNPIPTDSQVSQSVTQQNKKNDALDALLAARQALVVPVQQEAQITKYQTVDPQNIPAPSTTEPSADLVAKVKARQISLH